VNARAALLAAALAVLAADVARDAAADEPRAGALDMAEVDRLSAEGAKWFEAAGDADQPGPKRQEARNQAYTLLKKALAVLDAWCDAHPEDVEKLDPRMVDLHRMIFWLKKESPVPLGDSRPAPTAPASPEPQGPPPGGTAPSGGPAPAGPAPAGPAPGTAPQEPPRPAATAPAVRDPFAEAAAYERAHPSDEPGILEKWLEALNAAPDPDAPPARDALARVAKLSDSLKQYYRKVRNDDPDSLNPEKDAGRAAEVAAKIAAGLGAPDAAARRAAAAKLADLGYTPAGASLYDALRREKAPEVRRDIFLALVRLGGRRACENVAKFAKDRDADLQAESVRSLAAIAQKDAVQARYAALALADFAVEARVADSAGAAVKELARLGPAGVPALTKAIASKEASIELAVIDALGAAKDTRGAPVLCDRLDSDAPNSPRCEAAQRALREIARPAIPALIKALEKKKPRRLAGVLLYDLSGGQTFGEDAKAWAEWWKTQK
jgi:HEAT repeat protein